MANIRMLTARRELFEKEKLKQQGTIKAKRNQENDTQDVAKKTNTSEAARTAVKASRDASLAQAEIEVAASKIRTATIGAVIGAVGAIVSAVVAVANLSKGGKPNKPDDPDDKDKGLGKSNVGKNKGENKNTSLEASGKKDAEIENKFGSRKTKEVGVADSEINENTESSENIEGNRLGKESRKIGDGEVSNAPEKKVELTQEQKDAYAAEVENYSQLFKQLLALGTNNNVNIKSDVKIGKNNLIDAVGQDIGDVKAAINDARNGNSGKEDSELGRRISTRKEAKVNSVLSDIDKRIATLENKSTPEEDKVKLDGAVVGQKPKSENEASYKKLGILDKDGKVDETKLGQAKGKNEESLADAGITNTPEGITAALKSSENERTERGNQLSELKEFRNTRAGELKSGKKTGGFGDFLLGLLDNKFIKTLTGVDFKKDDKQIAKDEVKNFVDDQVDKFKDANPKATKDQIKAVKDQLRQDVGLEPKKLSKSQIGSLAKQTGLDENQVQKYFTVDKEGNIGLKKGKGEDGNIISGVFNGDAFQSESNLARDIASGAINSQKAAGVLAGLEQNDKAGLANQVGNELNSDNLNSGTIGGSKVDGKGKLEEILSSGTPNPTSGDLNFLTKSGVIQPQGSIAPGSPNDISVDNLLALSPENFERARQAVGLTNENLNAAIQTLPPEQKQALIDNGAINGDGSINMEKFRALTPAQQKDIMNNLIQSSPELKSAVNSGVENQRSASAASESGGATGASPTRPRLEGLAKPGSDPQDDENKITGGAKNKGEEANWYNKMIIGLNGAMPAIQFMLQQLDKLREAQDQMNEAIAKRNAARKLEAAVATELKRTQGSINEGTIGAGDGLNKG